ncbi:MAG: AAA family ATPase [Cellulosilyticaceae bacterium]
MESNKKIKNKTRNSKSPIITFEEFEIKRKEEQINKIWVSNYKSIKAKQEIEIKPLTILAGANSSGKSSIFQPLLILKQSLESKYDAGALLLNGPILQITDFDELVTHPKDVETSSFSIGFSSSRRDLEITYQKSIEDGKIDIEAIRIKDRELQRWNTLKPRSTPAEIKKIYPNLAKIEEIFKKLDKNKMSWRLKRDKCFLTLENYIEDNGEIGLPTLKIAETEEIARQLREIIYLPGLRSTPERTYPVTAIENENIFEGKFENYIASIIASWYKNNDTNNIDLLNRYLRELQLTNNVEISLLNDAQIQILVNRYLNSDNKDSVNIADVGLGVSQILPLLVGLIVAKKGQIVYVEQPEIHLHPKAHTALARVIGEVISRGVSVVLETHSELLLKQFQVLIVKGKIKHEEVKLHWFERDNDGFTLVTSADVDKEGSFGEWPQDFADIVLKVEGEYLAEIEESLFK